jgi:hypothetical protein
VGSQRAISWIGETASDFLSKYRSEQEAGDVSPTESAVFWECQLATSLVKLVSSTLGAINRALSGQGLLSQDALASAKALLGNSIPQAWDRLWEVRLQSCMFDGLVTSSVAVFSILGMRGAIHRTPFGTRPNLIGPSAVCKGPPRKDCRAGLGPSLRGTRISFQCIVKKFLYSSSSMPGALHWACLAVVVASAKHSVRTYAVM